ncbi:hypothetical protein HDU98_000953 [Podochytrium sp. JEL0797]|nr:hypothetical protein HDU98_000953 [Podochytrium sp. JEL0797]
MSSISRVNAQGLQRSINKTVTLVGRVVSFAGASAVIEACDGGHVNVHLLPGSNVDQDQCVVEVIGIVNQDMSVQEQASSKFEGTYDNLAYSRMLEVAEKYSEIC